MQVNQSEMGRSDLVTEVHAREPARMAAIRVLIADDDEVVRDALVDLVDGEDAYTVVAAAADADEAVTLAAEHLPQVAVVDVRMPGGGGPEACRGILRVSPATKVIALSAFDRPGPRAEMAAAGAVRYLVKGLVADELLAAISEAAAPR